MSDKKLATVDPIRENWGARAALGDAMQRCPNENGILITWFGEDGLVRHAAANVTRKETLWLAMYHVLAAYDEQA